MKAKTYLILSLSCLLSILHINKAYSQELQKTFKQWTVYTAYTDNLKLCYMVSYPTKRKGNFKGAQEPYVMVTNVNGKNTEISVTSGYRYSAKNPPVLVIDGEDRKLSIVQNQTAWFKLDKSDDITIEKMKKGNTMLVKARTRNGSTTTDTYSLMGFTNAYNKINELCKR